MTRPCDILLPPVKKATRKTHHPLRDIPHVIQQQRQQHQPPRKTTAPQQQQHRHPPRVKALPPLNGMNLFMPQRPLVQCRPLRQHKTKQHNCRVPPPQQQFRQPAFVINYFHISPPFFCKTKNNPLLQPFARKPVLPENCRQLPARNHKIMNRPFPEPTVPRNRPVCPEQQRLSRVVWRNNRCVEGQTHRISIRFHQPVTQNSTILLKNKPALHTRGTSTHTNAVNEISDGASGFHAIHHTHLLVAVIIRRKQRPFNTITLRRRKRHHHRELALTPQLCPRVIIIIHPVELQRKHTLLPAGSLHHQSSPEKTHPTPPITAIRLTIDT
nr:MAG TPA: hypothetical protein [Caudoviricetes sp.]